MSFVRPLGFLTFFLLQRVRDKLSARLFENSIRIQIFIAIMTSLQVEQLRPLSLSPVYSVAVSVSGDVASFFWKPSRDIQLLGPGSRVLDVQLCLLLGQVL